MEEVGRRDGLMGAARQDGVTCVGFTPEASINFKALRAKFQEEALLAQSKSCRPTVAEKPKRLPPPGGSIFGSVVGGGAVVCDGKPSAAPQVFHREGLRASGGKRPISFPPQPPQSQSSLLCCGDGTKKNLLKERSLPLVLPVLPVKDQRLGLQPNEELKLEPEPDKEPLPQTKIKKKGLLLPFKSTKALKISGEMGAEVSRSDTTTRMAGALGELSSEEKTTSEDGRFVQADLPTTDSPLSSPDIPVTTPPAEASSEGESSILSTLERARKKFSSRQKLISIRPKTLHSPDYTSKGKEFPSPPKSTNSVWADLPLSPPHLSCISARPFFKVTTSVHKPSVSKQVDKDKTQHPTVKTCTSNGSPPKKPLPELRVLGRKPAKPTRPPLLDLSCYRARINATSPKQPTSEEPRLPPVLPPVPNAHTFQDSSVHVTALEGKPLDFISTDVPPPVDVGPSIDEGPQADTAACSAPVESGNGLIRDLNHGNPKLIPLHPESFHEPINLSEFPELGLPEGWSPRKEALVNSCLPPPDESRAAAAQCQSVPEEAGLSRSTTWSTEIPKPPSVYPQNGYFQTCDNVYEDVENVNKSTFSQTCTDIKPQGSVKNPYAGNCTMMADSGVKRPRHPWGSVSGEPAHSGHIHTPSKDQQSPNTADYKEQKRREKQRLGKERKEQKEREKKENEMKKRFKVTGDEEPMYHAKVMVASKVRKHDLPVKSGDTVSIIRTTNCPKGKWLARDADNRYGYISVMNVELNIQEMLELGKKAQAAGRGANAEGDNISIESRSSNHPVLTSSFTDDSEEWACEDETLSPSIESHSFSHPTTSVSEMSCPHVGSLHMLSDINLEDVHTQTRNDALQKLAIFFQHNKNELSDVLEADGATPTNDEPQSFLCAVEEPPYPEQEVDFKDLEFLPPPPLYADST